MADIPKKDPTCGYCSSEIPVADVGAAFGYEHLHLGCYREIEAAKQAVRESEKPDPLRRIVSDIARIAHYSLDGTTKENTAKDLAHEVRRLNASASNPWTDAELTQLLGRAAGRSQPHV